MFVSAGHPPRWDARCPNSGGRERHRLLHSWVIQRGRDKPGGKQVLRFAPDKMTLCQMLGNMLYETADLHQPGVTHRRDIAHAELPDTSGDVVIANHVPERIANDRTAIRELYGLFEPGGVALPSVPVNTSREETYENPAITAPVERDAHFTAEDHIRYYALESAERVCEAEFEAETFRMTPEEKVLYGSLRDDWLDVASETPLLPAAGQLGAPEPRG